MSFRRLLAVVARAHPSNGAVSAVLLADFVELPEGIPVLRELAWYLGTIREKPPSHAGAQLTPREHHRRPR